MAFAAAVVLDVSAHRRDEYLQAARVAIEPGRVEVFLDLTPGIALADGILAEIDRNGDGTLSAGEQRAYASLVVSGLQIEVDGRSLIAQLDASSFPDVEAIRRGEGFISVHAIARLPSPPLAAGDHRLMFRHRHHREGRVYLANALVPGSRRLAVTAQHRDGDQRELTIDYVLRGPLVSPTIMTGLLAGLAGVAVLLVSHRIRRVITDGIRHRDGHERRRPHQGRA